MKREFSVGKKSQENLLSALSEIATAVGSTLGPGGRQFGFDKLGVDMRLTATFSKDGLTVLKSLGSDIPSWQAVLHYSKQAAFHSVAASGDGSTSTIVLANAVAQAVFNSGAKWPQAFARKIEADAIRAIEEIKKEAIRTEDAVKKVAMTSTNGDEELTDVVLEAIKNSSAFGTLLVEKNPISPVRYKISRQDGYAYCHGYNYHSTFALSASSEAAASKPIEWENPEILIFNGSLFTQTQLEPIINAWNAMVTRGVSKNLVILAFEVGEEIANKLMVLNRNMAKHGVGVFVVKPRLTAEINSAVQVMMDIASFCGIEDSKIVDGGNLRDVNETYFGKCKKIKISQTNTSFLGRSDKHWVDKRIKQNLSIVEEARSEFDRQISAIRNAELAEGLVKVEVGGGHLSDLQERADRFDDASKAAQSCLAHGALPGAGCSYIRAGMLANVHPALMQALRSIYENVLKNYGTNYNEAFCPEKGQTVSITGSDDAVYGNAMELGIIDSCETVCEAIKNGVSLGVKIATIGGYSYRDLNKQLDDFEA